MEENTQAEEKKLYLMKRESELTYKKMKECTALKESLKQVDPKDLVELKKIRVSIYHLCKEKGN